MFLPLLFLPRGIGIESTLGLGNTVSQNNLIQNNTIGLNKNGDASLGSIYRGVEIVNASNNQIGTANNGNWIVGNNVGVQVGGTSSSNSIQANTIGLNTTLTTAIPNFRGIVLTDSATNTLVGGFAPDQRNIISGNFTGVYLNLNATQTQINGNWIGTDGNQSATSGFPNTFNGVWVNGGTRSILNGNTIVRSGKAGASTNNSGVYVDNGDVTLTKNAIYRNLGPSIAVANSTASIALSQARVDGYALGMIAGATPNTTYTVEFFAAVQQGQAEQYIGTSAVVTDENGSADFEISGLGDLPPGRFLTATITGANAEGGDLLQTSPLAAGVLPTAALIRGLPSRSPEGTPISLKAFAVTSTINGYAVTGYQWNVTKGGIRYATGSEAGIQFAPDDEGTYIVTLQLTLTNAAGDQQTSLLGPHSIAVFNVAPTPQFDYSPTSPRLGQLVTLKSNTSDPGQLDVLSYAWEVRYGSSAGPVVPLTNPSAATASFTPVAGGLYFAKLTVDDNDGGATGFRTLTRQIEVSGLPSAVTILSPSTGSEGQTVRARVPESELIRAEQFGFNWSVTKTPVTGPVITNYPFTEPSRGVVEFVPDDDGLYRIDLILQDLNDLTATPLTAPAVNVAITNASPIVAVTSPSNTATINSPINVVAKITDPGKADLPILDLVWSIERNGSPLPGAGTVGIPNTNFSYTPTRGGVYTIKAVATDDDYSATTGIGRGSGQQVFYVSDVGIPLAVNSPTGPFTEATPYSFSSTLGSLPAGVTVSSYKWTAESVNGRIVQSDSASVSTIPNFVFTPPQGGFYRVSLSLVLSNGQVAHAGSAPFNVIGLAPVIDSIVIVSPPTTVTIAEGMEVTVRAAATDLGEPIGLSYRWQIKRGTGAFVDVEGVSSRPTDMKFTPTDDDTYTVRVIVTDSQGNAVHLDRAIVVANAPPTVRLEVASVIGNNVTFNALGSDPGLDDRPGLAYAWSVNGGAFVTGTSLSPSIDVNTAVRLSVRVTDDTTITVVNSYILADAAGTNVKAIDGAVETLAGPAADQIVYLGLGGNDVITVAAGLTKKVVVFGGDGNDTINAALATSPVFLDGGVGDDMLTGGSGDDVLVAGPGTNILVGGNGNNRFVGGGNDTMTGGINSDYYEVHFSTVVLNDVGGGDDTVDLTAAPTGVTLDFSLTTGNVAQSVFAGSTLTLNGTFQSLVGSPFGDTLSASMPGVTINGGAGNDTLSATGIDSSLDGGADNDLLVLSNAAGVFVGGDGNDTFTGTLVDTQTTVLDGGAGNDTWNLSGPSTGVKVTVAITGGSGVSTVNATYIKGKISTEGGNATGLLSEFGSAISPSSLIATVSNSNDISIFGGTVRGSSISVSNSNDVSIFGGGGDTVLLTGVLRGTIQGGLFGGVAAPNPLIANVTNSNDIDIFGSSTQQSLLTSTVTNSNDISIFGGVKSQITVISSNDIGIFGVSEGSIVVGAPTGSLSNRVQLHISDFGSAAASPVLSISVTNSNDIGIFGSAAANSAPLLATVTNSNDISIFGSASQSVNISVTGSQDIGIFGVVDGTLRLGPSDVTTVGQGVSRARIETAGFGSVSLSTSLNISVINSNDIGIFGSSLATSPMNATVTNSNDINIFGSVVQGGILQATNSNDIGIFAQASAEVLLQSITRGNIFAETFGTGQVPSRLSISVATNSNDIGIFGGTTRNSVISVTGSNDISIFGGTAVNTIEGVTYVGDTVSFDSVTSGTIAGGVFGVAPPALGSSTILQANVLDSSKITIFGSALGTANVSVVNSQDISIFGGFGDVVELMSSTRVRVEGGVFGSSTANQSGLTASVAGNSNDIGIFGTNVNDTVRVHAGTLVGVDTRAGSDTLEISNVNTFVGLTDAGDDYVTVNSGTDILLYLAAGTDRAQINGGSNIRAIGAEGDDTFYIAGGSELDIDGGDGADTSIIIGGSSLSIRSDAGNDVQKIFGDANGYFNGGAGDETTQFYGGSGKASLPGQIDVVIDGQAGNDTLEVRPMLNEQTRLSIGRPNPFAGIPAWIVLPTALTTPAFNRNPSSAALIGGDGDDTLILEGNQRLYALGGEGNDTIRLIAGSNSFAVGGGGDDTIEINSEGIDNQVFGDEGDDNVVVTNGNRLAVFTEQGDDTVVFNGGSRSYARTGVGQDTITVNGGSDLIVSAEEGFDTININDGTNILAGGGSDGDAITVFGGTNPIALGESGNDHLKYVAGTMAILSGGDGDDLIEASGRNADLYGDDGDDQYKILPTAATAPFQLRLRELQFIDPNNFESEARGSDSIDLSAFAIGASLDLRTTEMVQGVIAGQIELFLTGSFEDIVGTDGNDTLTGTRKNNRLEGRGGDDTLIGLAGEDTLVGGTGNDLLDGGTGDDAYVFATSLGESLGNDTIYENTSSGIDLVEFSGLPVGLGTYDMNAPNSILAGGLLNLTVRKSVLDASTGDIEEVMGTAFADMVIGSELDNRFELLAGNDMVDGRGGSDIYQFRGTGLGSDTITDASTGSGRDTLDFTGLDAPLIVDLSVTAAQPQLGAVTITLTSPDSIENVVGTSFADVLIGNALDNTIYGAAGSDTMDGRDGNDRLFANLTSVVLLDFDSAYDATRGDFNYTPADRNTILASMQVDYAAFDWRFTQSEAEAKSWTADSGRSFVRLMFCQGRGGGVSGDAGEVDFRNVNRRIVSEVNINSLKSAIAEIVGTNDTSAVAFRAAAVALTSTIASHELAHTAGVRHADAFGPIGTGVSPNVDTNRIYPELTGPRLATETNLHLIASPASVGSTISDAARDLFFGERESIRLAFNEIGRSILEAHSGLNGHNTIASANDLGELAQLYVPNNAPAGLTNSGKLFDVSAMAVVGELKHDVALNSTEKDYYKFTGRAGEYVNSELLVNSLLPRRGDSFDGDLRIYDASGVLIAENDDDFEGTKDASLFDVLLPADGDYYVSVQLSPQPAIDAKGGRYELFLSRFRAVPNNTLLRSSVGDTLLGGVGANVLTGSAADDLFRAVAADPTQVDYLFGGPGFDSLETQGFDYAYVADSIERLPVIPAVAATLNSGSGALTITDTNGTKNNTFTVKRVNISGTDFLEFTDANEQFAGVPTTSPVSTLSNGNRTLQVLMAAITTLTVNGTGGTDRLTLDYSGGPLPMVNYDGGNPTTAPGDRLRIMGTGGSAVNHAPHASITGSGIITIAGSPAVTYAGLEAVDFQGGGGGGTFAMTFPNANDVIALANGVDGFEGNAIEISGMSGGIAFESALVSGYTNVVIDTATVDGNDTINVTSSNNAHSNTNLTIRSGSGNDVVNLAAGITVAGAFSVNTGALNLGSSAIQAGTDIILSARDTISLTAPLSTGATGLVSVTSTNGAIIDGNDGIPGTLNITAQRLALSASTGIGAAGQVGEIETQVSMVEAGTVTGGVILNNTGNLSIGGVTGPLNGIRATTSGDIRVSTRGNILATSAGETIQSANGNVTLSAIGATADMTIANGSSPAVQALGAATAVLIMAGQDIFLGDASGNQGDVTATNVTLSLVRDLILNSDSDVLANGGTLVATAGRNISLLKTGVPGSSLSSGGPAVNITTGANGVFTLDAGVGGTVSNTANFPVTITADDVVLIGPATISAGSNAVAIKQVTNARPIDLGTNTPSQLGLTDAELDLVSAGAIHIGDTNSGNVTFSSQIDLAGTNALAVTTGGDITQGFSGTAISGDTLILKGDLAPRLASTGNLTVNGPVSFDATASYEVNLNGTANYDQLVVAGDNRTTTLGGADLVITLDTVPPIGSQQVFRVVDSTGTGSTASGTFRKGFTTLNDGDTFTVGSTIFRINYNPANAAGDVTLTEAGNTPPIVDLNGLNDADLNFIASFVEDAGAVNITDTDASIADTENSTLANLQLVVSANPNGAAEVGTIAGVAVPLNADKTGTGTVGITTFQVAYLASTRTFTITKNGGGEASIGDLQTLLRGITYNNTDHNPNTTARTIAITANDGIADSSVAFATITVMAVNDAPVGVPTITGTPTEDRVLTAVTSGISDADGLGTFTYQWQRATDAAFTAGVVTVGSNATTYTLGDADVAKYIRVRVTYTDGNATAEGPLASTSIGPIVTGVGVGTVRSVQVLNATACGSLTLTGNAMITVAGPVQVNSNCASSAIVASGNARITASQVRVVGGVQKTENASISPSPITGSAPVVDPLGSIAAPTGNPATTAISCSGNTVLTVGPGSYTSITASGNCRLTFQPGVYVIDGGGMNVSLNASVTGSNVMFYNAGSNFPNLGGSFGRINFSGNGTFNLNPPTTGVYSGVTFFQARDNTQTLSIPQKPWPISIPSLSLCGREA